MKKAYVNSMIIRLIITANLIHSMTMNRRAPISGPKVCDASPHLRHLKKSRNIIKKFIILN